MFLPDPTGRKRPLKAKLIWATVFLLLIALGIAAKPAYDHFKKKRSTSMAAQAEELMAKEQWEPAFQKLQAALQMDPMDMRANRAMAKLLTMSRKEEAFRFWNIVFNHGAATVEDRVEVIQLALALRRMDVAERFLTEALKDNPPPREIVRAAAFFSDIRNDTAASIKFSRAALAIVPNDPPVQYILARHLFRTGQTEDAEEAKTLLWAILKEHPNDSMNVIQMLAAAPTLHRKELEDLLAVIEKQANATNNLNLVKIDVLARLSPEKKDELLAETIAAANQSPQQLLATARYLNQKKEYGATIKLVKREDALASRDLFLVYADALAAVGYWLELQEIFENDKLPIDAVLTELYRARIATELKDVRRAARHWDQVHWKAGTNPEALTYVGEYAERIGEFQQAARAFRELTKDPRHARTAFAALIRLAERQGDTPELKNLIEAMAALYPNDSAPQNDLAYLNLLLKQDITGASAIAEELVKAEPGMLAYRTTLALSYLRRNQVDAAKKTYDGVTFEWGKALPGWQAVYIAVMGAAGETEVVKKLIPTIPLNRLKPQEKELIQAWL